MCKPLAIAAKLAASETKEVIPAITAANLPAAASISQFILSVQLPSSRDRWNSEVRPVPR